MAETAKKTEARPPRRVLFVAGRLDPTAPSRYLAGLARRLHDKGYQVDVVASHGSFAQVFPQARRHQDAHHHIPIHLSRALKTNLGARLNLAGLVGRVKEIAPDIIHVHWSRLSGVGARLVRSLRKPYVLSVGGFLDPGESITLSRRFIRKIVVASDAVRVDLVNRIRIDRELISVVPDGVALPDYAFDKVVLPPGHIPVVGAIGRFVESQGQRRICWPRAGVLSRWSLPGPGRNASDCKIWWSSSACWTV